MDFGWRRRVAQGPSTPAGERICALLTALGMTLGKDSLPHCARDFGARLRQSPQHAMVGRAADPVGQRPPGLKASSDSP